MTDTWTADELRRWCMERWCPNGHPQVDGVKCSNCAGCRDPLFTRCPDCKPDGLEWEEIGWWLDVHNDEARRVCCISPSHAAALILVATVESGNAAWNRIAKGGTVPGNLWADWTAAVLSMKLRDIIDQRQRLADLEQKHE